MNQPAPTHPSRWSRPFPMPTTDALITAYYDAVPRRHRRRRRAKTEARRPRPTCPDPGTRPAAPTRRLRAELWHWLDNVVTWLNHEYVWDPAAGIIPPCWPQHPHLVHEIAVLADQRRRAGLDLTSSSLEEWHRYCLPAFLERLKARSSNRLRRTPQPLARPTPPRPAPTPRHLAHRRLQQRPGQSQRHAAAATTGRRTTTPNPRPGAARRPGHRQVTSPAARSRQRRNNQPPHRRSLVACHQPGAMRQVPRVVPPSQTVSLDVRLCRWQRAKEGNGLSEPGRNTPGGLIGSRDRLGHVPADGAR